ncbi:MAG TPA: tetratricopeptide repeat protein [Bacteroidia bacterium]|jgi:tetratricopeptide (TPR) repeat protein|nr:tetratricopeptide repeat protein [Bacteroidia bacterium]
MKNIVSLLLLSSVWILSPSCRNQNTPPKTNPGSDTTAAALEDINVRLRSNPGDASLYQERARFFIARKKFDEALADMNRVLKIDSTKAEYYLTLADVYFMANKTRDSRTALEKCNKLDPKNKECIMKLAELYFYVRKYQQSLNYLDEALKLDQYNAKAYFMKGMNFKESGDTAKAISSMQTAVEQDNGYYNAYIQLGLLCAAQHNKLAEDYYANALRIQPNSTEALYDAGILYQQEGNYEKAQMLYKKLLELNKNLFDGYYNLGVISVATKEYKEALNYFSQAISVDPKNARGYYGRGYCYQMMGNVQNGSADYRYALTLDPDFEAAKTGLKEMKIY